MCAASTGTIRTAVITGGHDYDVVSFQSMLRSLPGIDAYPQNLWDFVNDSGEGGGQYEALLFYNMHTRTPDDADGEHAALVRRTIEGLGEGRAGLFLLHHALVAFPEWPVWAELSGVPRRSRVQGVVDQRVHVEVADPDHPITAGLGSWDIVDETYVTGDADPASRVLLATDHPQSMSTIAWTRAYGKARVFCYQNGHDDSAFSDPNFRTVVTRGIQWLAGRI